MMFYIISAHVNYDLNKDEVFSVSPYCSKAVINKSGTLCVFREWYIETDSKRSSNQLSQAMQT
jgi:hypothetical protein